jgi:hypothetical protein
MDDNTNPITPAITNDPHNHSYNLYLHTSQQQPPATLCERVRVVSQRIRESEAAGEAVQLMNGRGIYDAVVVGVNPDACTENRLLLQMFGGRRA